MQSLKNCSPQDADRQCAPHSINQEWGTPRMQEEEDFRREELRELQESGEGHRVPLQFSSVTQSCPTLCNPMNHSRPGLPVHHQLPEFTQNHVHWVGDASQPSHPLSSLSPLAPNPSQNQSLFQWVNSSHQVVKVLEFQLQHQSFQWTPRTDLL